jgi:hypothetical protein
MPRRTLILFILAICYSGSGQAQQPLLGVLEEVPAPSSADENFRAVRVLFEKTADGWQPFPSACPDRQCLKSVTAKFPQQTTWTIAFEGKSLGKVTAQTPAAFAYYSQIGLQRITSGSPVSTIGEPTVEFGATADQPLLRPLVAVSAPDFQDPDNWKTLTMSAEQLALVRREFRQRFRKLCRLSQDETKVESRPYTDSEIQTVKAYGSNSNWVLAHLHIDDAIACSENEAGFQMLDPWFTISPSKTASYMGAGLALVDAGDYDNSGHSQLLFTMSGYNLGGYILYFDNFAHRATFAYSYH